MKATEKFLQKHKLIEIHHRTWILLVQGHFFQIVVVQQKQMEFVFSVWMHVA